MNEKVGCWAIIPAAGIGQRSGSNIPKQYIQISGKTILEHALTPFLDNPRIKAIVIVLNKDDSHFSDLDIHSTKEIHTVIGGDSRTQSVFNALLEIKPRITNDEYVLVHDAARPCLSNNDLDKLMDAAFSNEAGCILGAPMVDTVKKVDNDRIVKTMDRSNLWRAYTPQMFRYELLLNALSDCINKNIPITDEASAIEVAGLMPGIVLGQASNIKVTTADDLMIAEKFLSAE
ncbi:MAG: 2-C-methyl-D-erythritol 4-phosphate cytidylyltransferase [Pseudomonadota bacterium]